MRSFGAARRVGRCLAMQSSGLATVTFILIGSTLLGFTPFDCFSVDCAGAVSANDDGLLDRTLFVLFESLFVLLKRCSGVWCFVTVELFGSFFLLVKCGDE